MSHRPWLGLVAVAAMLVAGCTAPPPPPPPPTGHNCLSFWGASAQDLKSALDAMQAAKGNGWALHAPKEAVYNKLVQLSLSLERALGAEHLEAMLWVDDNASVNPSIGIGADNVFAQLNLDVGTGIHGPPASGWLTSPNPANPAIPLAHGLLQSIREAVDM